MGVYYNNNSIMDVALNNISPNSCKMRFAHRFLTSLSRMKRDDHLIVMSTTSDDQDLTLKKRSKRIKVAAYSCMAHAVGTGRAWSRAILFKLRTRVRVGRRPHGLIKSTKQTQKLRSLVPGGKGMDVCSLLEETAHYIHCLSTQVKVMKAISDHYSSTLLP